MCGRYANTKVALDVEALYGARFVHGEELPPSWNVAPTDPVYGVVDARSGDRPGRELNTYRWGLVPWFMKDKKGAARMINARAETLTTSRAYRQAAAQRRLLLPASGWFEWRRADGGKRPFYMTAGDGVGLTVAGLWERWRDPEGPDGAELFTCTIVTTAAVGQLAGIHDRMSVLLPGNRWDAWLDPDRSDPSDLLAPDEDLVASLELRPVGQPWETCATTRPTSSPASRSDRLSTGSHGSATVYQREAGESVGDDAGGVLEAAVDSSVRPGDAVTAAGLRWPCPLAEQSIREGARNEFGPISDSRSG